MLLAFYTKRIKYESMIGRAGFTLIETLVSMSIFTIVVSMSMGTLLVLIDANGKAQNEQSVVTNISFALDSMSREIRTGSHYYCASDSAPTDEMQTRDCLTGAGGFAFTEAGDSLTTGMSDSRISYRLTGATIERQLSSTGSWIAVTAPDVTIDTLDFVVTNTDPLSAPSGDTKSPTVTIYITATVGDIEGIDATVQMQTTVTQQILDL